VRRVQVDAAPGYYSLLTTHHSLLTAPADLGVA